jgi:hypothetical protein
LFKYIKIIQVIPIAFEVRSVGSVGRRAIAIKKEGEKRKANNF